MQKMFGLMWLLWAALLPWAHAIAPVELYVAEAPPLTMGNVPAGHGVVGDVTLAAMARAGYAAQIQMLPWARAQREVSRGKNQLIIPLSRTPERESQYTWIAPVIPLGRAFFSLNKPVADFAEARSRYKTIAVGAGTAQMEILKHNGFNDTQIEPIRLGDVPLRMLELERVDAWFTSVYEGLYDWPGKDASKISARLQMSPVVSTVDLYLACSLVCDEGMVTNLREAVQSLQADGTVKRIERKYIRTLNGSVSKPPRSGAS